MRVGSEAWKFAGSWWGACWEPWPTVELCWPQAAVQKCSCRHRPSLTPDSCWSACSHGCTPARLDMQSPCRCWELLPWKLSFQPVETKQHHFPTSYVSKEAVHVSLVCLTRLKNISLFLKNIWSGAILPGRPVLFKLSVPQKTWHASQHCAAPRTMWHSTLCGCCIPFSYSTSSCPLSCSCSCITSIYVIINYFWLMYMKVFVTFVVEKFLFPIIFPIHICCV